MGSDQDDNEPYTRWQGLRIGQLGVCISLFLTFSVAVLGFSVNLIVQPNYAITDCFARVFFLFSLLFGLLSVLLGSLACTTRLKDFRLTAQVVRNRSDSSMKEGVERWRAEYRRLGGWTWKLFKWQLLLFGFQIVGLTLAISITYWPRLI